MSRARDLANLHSSTDLNIDNNTFVVDKSENKIGIATTAPNAPLEIDGNASDDTTVELLRLSANQGVGQATNLIFKTRRDEDGGSALFSSIESARNDGGTTGLNLLLQPSGGNVGIGTDSPTSDGGTTLEIYNASTPTLRLNDGGDYKALVQLRGNDTEIRGSSGNMEFYTGNADGESSTERMKIASAGDVTVSTGNLVIGTAGKGVDFTAGNPALQNSATSSGQVLDVYEQGSWTITNTSGSGGTASLDNYTGYYTRIGNHVFCTGYIKVRSDSSTSYTFGGLPFNSANHDGARGGGSAGFNNEIATTLNIICDKNSSNFNFYSGSSIEDFSSSKEIYFTLHYIAEL